MAFFAGLAIDNLEENGGLVYSLLTLN